MGLQKRQRHTEGLRDLCCSSASVTVVMRSWKMSYAGHAARMGTREMHTQFLWEKLKETDHLEDLAADDRMLNWNLKKRD